MAHVITDACTKLTLCVDVCPNDCIHPTKTETAFATATQLYIDPAECLDCGACVSVCTANAIFPSEELPDDKKNFAAKNAEFFKK
jgi:NAD-dependent dihydropyrimidine dehydrogenase PreA subunit